METLAKAEKVEIQGSGRIEELSGKKKKSAKCISQLELRLLKEENASDNFEISNRYNRLIQVES